MLGKKLHYFRGGGIWGSTNMTMERVRRNRSDKFQSLSPA